MNSEAIVVFRREPRLISYSSIYWGLPYDPYYLLDVAGALPQEPARLLLQYAAVSAGLLPTSMDGTAHDSVQTLKAKFAERQGLLREAYTSLASVYHPDASPTDAEGPSPAGAAPIAGQDVARVNSFYSWISPSSMFSLLNSAYRALADPFECLRVCLLKAAASPAGGAEAEEHRQLHRLYRRLRAEVESHRHGLNAAKGAYEAAAHQQRTWGDAFVVLLGAYGERRDLEALADALRQQQHRPGQANEAAASADSADAIRRARSKGRGATASAGADMAEGLPPGVAATAAVARKLCYAVGSVLEEGAADITAAVSSQRRRLIRQLFPAAAGATGAPAAADMEAPRMLDITAVLQACVEFLEPATAGAAPRAQLVLPPLSALEANGGADPATAGTRSGGTLNASASHGGMPAHSASSSSSCGAVQSPLSACLWDVAEGAAKSLYVRYAFRGVLHEAVFDEGPLPIKAPLRKHCVRREVEPGAAVQAVGARRHKGTQQPAAEADQLVRLMPDPIAFVLSGPVRDALFAPPAATVEPRYSLLVDSSNVTVRAAPLTAAKDRGNRPDRGASVSAKDVANKVTLTEQDSLSPTLVLEDLPSPTPVVAADMGAVESAPIAVPRTPVAVRSAAPRVESLLTPHRAAAMAPQQQQYTNRKTLQATLAKVRTDAQGLAISQSAGPAHGPHSFSGVGRFDFDAVLSHQDNAPKKQSSLSLAGLCDTFIKYPFTTSVAVLTIAAGIAIGVSALSSRHANLGTHLKPTASRMAKSAVALALASGTVTGAHESVMDVSEASSVFINADETSNSMDETA